MSGVVKRTTILSMLREHNRLNGFGFVLIEFGVIAIAALVPFLLAAVVTCSPRCDDSSPENYAENRGPNAQT